ncbi:leucine-rich repeat-containing protein 37B-like, partial [Sagmatias obliquidens]|uniref:leucine-rich repeat-containing protein 37B-like n=1 Tax=Sagmatias obliquidens TaxID=3371155 RepID=UPI000F43E6F2
EQPAQPPEPSSGEVEPSPTQQEQPAQPPEHHEMTVSPPSHPQAQHSDLSVRQGPPIQPPYPEVTFPNPEQVQARHPTLIEVTIQPLDLGLTRRPEPTKEDEPSPVMQETLTQPAEPPQEVFVAQPPVYHNPIVPTPHQDHTEPPTSPSIT